ncbi:P-type DNA transfer protein VirB5 [Bordetella bronchiseptica]|uniref:P-type DNA transfer protein VirB5 n=1 Tax=Bordetella bronchiseptica TaxID=518 RepID=UPI000D735071|nr:P-type DNA transfer protein VirB5 [Bordetella bronchiseptica]AWQ03656.1 P-type DNA transfer protein VirB5 [Bordetella bronchiseptica]
MKKLSASCILAVGIAASSAAFAQIPVTDGASIAKSVENQIETMAKWKMQHDQMVSQIDQMKQQYAAVTGARGMGELFNNPQLRDYLPQDWQGVYDSVKSGGYAGLSGRAESIYNDNKVYDACAGLSSMEQRVNCEAQAVKGAQDKAFSLDAYDAAKNRLNQIDQLMRQINQTQDPKSIAELQGRIAAEQAMIQNEQTKLQMYQMVAAAEDRLQQQRRKEINAKIVDQRGYPILQVFNPLAR